MKLTFIFALIISLTFITQPTTQIFISTNEVLDLIKLSKDIVLWVSKAWNVIDGNVDFSTLPAQLVDKTEVKLFNKMSIISKKLNQVSNRVDEIGVQIQSLLLNNLPRRIRSELHFNDLLNSLKFINNKHKDFQEYLKNREKIENDTLIDFADNTVSSNYNSIISNMEYIHSFIVSPVHGGDIFSSDVLSSVAEYLKEIEGDMLCNSQQSPQQVLFNFYNTIALTELKGYTMVQFAYMIKRLYGKGNFTIEAQLAKDKYKLYTDNIVKSVKNVMETASKTYWVCDPKKHVKGETYEEITQLLQGYVQNEVDLNPEGTCRENCAEYKYTKSHGCFKNLYCQKQRRCNGKIIDCKFVDSDMWVCPADISTKRRYEYIEYENGRVLGRKQGCQRGTTKVESWWRWLFWHCSYCFCLCDEQSIYSDRYFNLRGATADIKNNRVVTGLRFTKYNRIIHLQIQEGELLARGNINRDTLHWVPVHDYKITDSEVYNGQDFHTLTWEKRAIDLDDLIADDGYVITGVRFKMIGSHLNLEILITPFDFETGKLIDPENRSIYKDNPNTDSSFSNPRTRVNLVNPDISIRSPSMSIPDSKSDQYIEFTHTDYDRDAAQTTVPFIDTQNVESLNPVPLIGIGIYHKGRRNFGGFIAPKIITYDFTKLLQPAFIDNEPQVN